MTLYFLHSLLVLFLQVVMQRKDEHNPSFADPGFET